MHLEPVKAGILDVAIVGKDVQLYVGGGFKMAASHLQS